MNQIVKVLNPPCYLLQGDNTPVLISESFVSKIAIGPEESVLYDLMTTDYVYGAPIGDVFDPNHPKDKDGFIIRKRYKILAR